MTASLPMPMPVTAAPIRVRILTALTESPGLGALELAVVLGCDARRVAGTLPRMRDGGLVVAHELAQARTGHPARIWFAAPEGTPPRTESAAEVEARRRRARIQQAQRRERLVAEPVHLAPRPLWPTDTEPACEHADPGLFFGPELEAPQARAARVTAAQAVCSACPVRRSCLDGALARGDGWGVWGGVDLELKGSGQRNRAPKAARPGAVTPGRT